MVAHNLYEVVSGIDHARSSGMKVVTAALDQDPVERHSSERSVLIRTQFDSPVRVDGLKQTAYIPAGASWGDVVSAAAEHGLAAVHGAGASTDAISSLLNDGIGPYGRLFGIAANHVNSITVVTADGDIRLVTAATEPRLFWALRGGGYGFGIVTEVEISLQPIARIITASLHWDAANAGAIAPIWLEWCRIAPREVSTSLRIVAPSDPPGVSGVGDTRQLLALDIMLVVEEPEDTEAGHDLLDGLVDELRRAAKPLAEDRMEGCPDSLIADSIPRSGAVPTVSDTFLVSTLTAHDLEHLFISIGPDSESTLAEVELRQLGGDFADPRRNGGAFDRIEADFSLSAFAALSDDHSRIGHESFLASARARLSHRRTGYTLPLPPAGAVHPERVFSDEALDLIGEIRDEFDPTALFRRSTPGTAASAELSTRASENQK